MNIVCKNKLLDISRMQSFYSGKSIFLTGCTGAVGEVFLEKFLRCQVKIIYLLCRAKRGITATDRMKVICSSELFSKLHKQDPHFFERIQIIDGDVNALGLGLATTDRTELLNNVEIVVHLAADVRFDSPLQEICITNVRGTREILNIAKQMPQLLAFTYVSTAFSHCHRSRVLERFYPAPIDPEKMISIAEQIGNDSSSLLNVLTDKFIAPWPNTYTFSKAISEELIRLAENELPIIVIRPSIVTVTHEDPISGWGTNFYGLNGVLAAVGAGLLRVLSMKKNLKSNLICTDFVVNASMVAMFEMYQTNNTMHLDGINNKIILPAKVFNISLDKSDITQGAVASSMLERQSKCPSGSIVWYPRSTFSTCPILVPVYNVLYQFIPAVFFDIFLRLSNSKKRLLPITRKIALFSQKTNYFNQSERVFENNNIKDLWIGMTEQDRIYFPCDLDGFDWTAFSHKYLHGMRAYVLKDGLDKKSISMAKQKYFKFKIAHYVFLTIWNGFLLMLAISYGIYLPIFLSVSNGIFHRNGV